MAVIINIREYKVSDFISLDYGTEKITMTFFNGQVAVGGLGWTTSVAMTPRQARDIAKTLFDMAEKIEPNRI